MKSDINLKNLAIIVKVTGQAPVEGLDKRRQVDVHALPLDALLHSPSCPLLHWSVHGDDGDGGDDGGHLGGGEDRFPILREFSNCAFTGSLIKVGGYTSRGYSTRNWSVWMFHMILLNNYKVLVIQVSAGYEGVRQKASGRLQLKALIIFRWIWNPQTKKFTDPGIYMRHEHVNGDFTRFSCLIIISYWMGYMYK